MIEDIFAAIMCIISVAACVWCWWFDNGGTFRSEKKNRKE